MANVNRKEYAGVFVALSLLTLLELGVASVETTHTAPFVACLIALALGKALLVARLFMHLKYETRVLNLSVYVALAIPVLYAMVLIAEASWRMAR